MRTDAQPLLWPITTQGIVFILKYLNYFVFASSDLKKKEKFFRNILELKFKNKKKIKFITEAKI